MSGLTEGHYTQILAHGTHHPKANGKNFENVPYTRYLLHEQINLETHLFCMH